ncbi:CBASS oligonucleotide cyclase [Dyella choica]|uniref:Nucleotidyltransferase n=1 Tax=Dyella choica TaxID=1927959 RepID=A0A432M937_9GAMM|nr:CBASS oligonucleotide cyclase [Dyella choica]RUL77488.1 nucleotidyltransferase [Dyella choica]
MITLNEAFRKFRSRLELNDREQDNASARHNEVRDFLSTKFDIERDFLTGSYARYTKTKPLKDIDILFELGNDEQHYRKKSPSALIRAFHDALVEKYGKDNVKEDGRAVNVSFGVKPDQDDNTDYRILSIDAVPAFRSGSHYEIPDADTQEWIQTNPEIHDEKSIEANKAYSGEWKGLVRMLKYWNNNSKHGERPVKQSFMLEVMALDCLYGDWQGRFDYEFQGLFATLADRIFDPWPDPAGLGPPVSDSMTTLQKTRARDLLQAASQEASLAIHLARQGKNGEALAAWRNLFGPKFPLS